MYIEIENLTKFYRDQCVLSQISCSFEKRENPRDYRGAMAVEKPYC